MYIKTKSRPFQIYFQSVSIFALDFVSSSFLPMISNFTRQFLLRTADRHGITVQRPPFRATGPSQLETGTPGQRRNLANVCPPTATATTTSDIAPRHRRHSFGLVYRRRCAGSSRVFHLVPGRAHCNPRYSAAAVIARVLFGGASVSPPPGPSSALVGPSSAFVGPSVPPIGRCVGPFTCARSPADDVIGPFRVGAPAIRL